MKRFFIFILLLIVTITAFTPCCVEDECSADQITSTKSKQSEKKEGMCSPFFSCASCSGFTATEKQIKIPSAPVAIIQHQEIIFKSLLPTYYSSFWQPPRLV